MPHDAIVPGFHCGIRGQSHHARNMTLHIVEDIETFFKILVVECAPFDRLYVKIIYDRLRCLGVDGLVKFHHIDGL